MTLYTTLVEFSKLCAPFIPFMTEQIYQNLVLSVDPSAPESVHLCDFPKSNPAFNFPEIESDMDNIRKIVMLGRACRNEANIKNRQPLAQLFIQSDETINADYQDIILEELNIKSVTITQDASSFISYLFKPQMRTMGPKYGKLMKPIFDEIGKMDGASVMAQLNSGEPLTFTVEGTNVSITKEDVLVETKQRDGFVSDSDQGFTVVLDTNLTDALVEEGFVREFISKVQTMRKDSGLEVTDRITVSYSDSDKLAEIVSKNEEEIKGQLLADSISYTSVADATQWNINGEKVSIAITKA